MLDKNKSILIIQARCSSKRLPSKVLLPINSMPIIILAVKRAANKGRKIIVATSNHSSDDKLVKLLKKEKIPFFRGSLNNVLSRFAHIVKNSNPNQIVFRLTADNIFPDGNLLDELEEYFNKKKAEYLGCGKNSGLPNGLSVELTKAKHIIEANKKSISKFDKEHVTPFIKRKHKNYSFTKYKNFKMEHYRCTIDTLDDYKLIKNIFKNLKQNSIKIDFKKLLPKLKSTQFKMLNRKINKKIILGCAQLGSPYGINNGLVKPYTKTIKKIFKTLIDNNILSLDTARDYNNSEKIIGNFFKNQKNIVKKKIKVFTKLSALNSISKLNTKNEICKKVDNSIFSSLKYLRQKSIHTLLIHRVSQLEIKENIILNRLLELKKNRLITNIGASVQTPEELNKILKIKEINHIQLPMNILDWRWEKYIKKIIERKKNSNLTIHIRSVLLQGLFATNDLSKWRKANLNIHQSKTILNWFEKLKTKFKKNSIIDLSLAFANSINWVDGIVIGVDNTDQLEQCLFIINRSKLTKEEMKYLIKSRPKISSKTLNPAMWKN